MDRKTPIERYLLLYVPWGLSILLQGDPVISYFTAWLGSFYIFFLVFTGLIKPLPKDRKISEQLMRPVFLVQIIFCGYMACSSIFYFLSLIGYEDFHKINGPLIYVDEQKIQLVALCQRYYILGHAALVTGIVYFMNYPVKKKYYVEKDKIANLLLYFAFILLPVSILFLKIPGLSQFYYQFSTLSFMAGTLALAFAIPLKKIWNTAFCALLYMSNFYQALTSGFKEPIIISVLVLGIFLYPNYKKIVLMIFIPALLLLFMFLPTYNTIFRQNNWAGDVNAEDSYKLALDATLSNDQSENGTTWGFLVYRLSEVDMFTDFVQSTPKHIDYYGIQLLKQSAIAVVPRFFWPSKPITEDLVMQRVYDAGVISRNANVSAKPAFIVDAYLSWGTPGIFIALFLYGAVAQLISIKAEYLFGGYTLGTALVFSGLFQIFWRGLSFEFIINAVFWSYVSMFIIFKIFRHFKIIRDIE
jgi:hypothetical protein